MKKQTILLSLVALLTAGFALGAAELPKKRGHEDDESRRRLRKLRVDQHREYDDEKSETLRILGSEIRDSNLEVMAPRIMSLVKRGANPNCYTPGGGSLLRRYVWYDNLEVVALFLKHKADANKQDSLHQFATPLFYAESAPMVELLLSNGADVEHRDRDGQSVLHHICGCGSGKPLEVLMALCQAGIDGNTVNISGKNALNRILGRPLRPTEIMNNNEDIRLKMAGVLCWYGADRESLKKERGHPDFNKKRDDFIVRLNTLVETFPQKKEEKRALLAAVASELPCHLNRATVLVDLVTGYFGAFDLSMDDVNSWDRLLHNGG